jgi:ubiquinol-cytochrome c reductase cytochrome b subunit
MSLEAYNGYYCVLAIPDFSKGFLVRSMHITGTSACFALLYAHIFKIFYTAILFNSGWLPAVLGVIIYFLVVVIAFIGYVLPLSQMSFWGLTVFSNIISAVPVVGILICKWLWGGEFIQDFTMTKVFSLHVFLPFVLIMLFLAHILSLHTSLSSETLEDRFSFYAERMIFTTFFLYRDAFTLFLLIIVLSYMIVIYWDFVFHEESFEFTNVLKTPDKIIPEWFFLTFFGFIKCIPDKLGGLIVLIVAIIALVLSPVYIVSLLGFFPLKAINVSTVGVIFISLSIIGKLSTNVVLCFPMLDYLQGLVMFYLYYMLLKVI